MARRLSEFDYGDMHFSAYPAGGTDGMDAIFILAKGAIPAAVELVQNAQGLTAMLSPGFREKARAALSQVDGAPDALGLDVAALAPVLQAFKKVLESLPQEDREQLRQLLLFSGAISVIYPDTSPRGEGKVKDTLTRKLWDELFEGDGLGAWYVFARVVWLNVGKSSPALAALRRRSGTGTAPSSSGV